MLTDAAMRRAGLRSASVSHE